MQRVDKGGLFTIDFVGQTLANPNTFDHTIELHLEAVNLGNWVLSQAITKVLHSPMMTYAGEGIYKVWLLGAKVDDEQGYIEKLADELLETTKQIVPDWGGEDKLRIDWTQEYHNLE